MTPSHVLKQIMMLKILDNHHQIQKLIFQNGMGRGQLVGSVRYFEKQIGYFKTKIGCWGTIVTPDL